MRTPPDELIEDLREAARDAAAECWPVPLEEIVEWEAADFIEAARPVIQAAADGGDETARKLLAGEFPRTSDD